jgi:hypothetical protein
MDVFPNIFFLSQKWKHADLRPSSALHLAVFFQNPAGSIHFD